jgi:hypothetical protein
MNKEFIHYEQALALKELDYNEDCFGYYIGGKLFITTVVYNSTENVCKAPTFSQAFRWFREKYNLKGFISPIEYLDGTDDTYHWCIYNKCNSGNDQLTYEEAELECLKKLIELIKYESSNTKA